MTSKLRTGTTRPGAARGLLVVGLAMFLTGCSFYAERAARSGPAIIGVAENVGLWDCEDARDGATVVDFDESLWLPVGADPAELLSLAHVAAGPGDRATMTLVAANLAEYRSERGRVFTFERHGGSITYEGCVPWAWPLDEG